MGAVAAVAASDKQKNTNIKGCNTPSFLLFNLRRNMTLREEVRLTFTMTIRTTFFTTVGTAQ
jgi:hypothetical protein